MKKNLDHLCFLLTFVIYSLIVKGEVKYFFSGIKKSPGSGLYETFGIEGCWFAVIVMSSAALIVYIIGRNHRKRSII